jgi:UDP-glucose 4-epimerase
VFWDCNVGGTAVLLAAMRAAGVRRLVFSSSAAVYGQGGRGPLEAISENAVKAPSSPYGETKLAGEWMIESCCRAFGLTAVALRYFNAAGADPSGLIGEAHEPETHLIPLALAAGLGDGKALTVFGDDFDTPDGTCLRDYVHVSDLAAAHVAALEADLPSGAFEPVNIGGGQGRSVLEVVAAVARIMGRPAPHDIGRAAEILGWTPRCSDLDTIVRDALRWEGQPAFGRPGRRQA